MKLYLSKKASWTILLCLFAFDCFVSYWGVVYQGGREADLVIAPMVERYPFLYFLAIPIEVLIIIGLEKLFSWMVRKLFKNVDLLVMEKVILTSLAGYWALGNSSLNLIFLAGYHHLGIATCYLIQGIMVIPGVIYVVWVLKRQGGEEIARRR